MKEKQKEAGLRQAYSLELYIPTLHQPNSSLKRGKVISCRSHILNFMHHQLIPELAFPIFIHLAGGNVHYRPASTAC